jgi:hypothetical protein
MEMTDFFENHMLSMEKMDDFCEKKNRFSNRHFRFQGNGHWFFG